MPPRHQMPFNWLGMPPRQAGPGPFQRPPFNPGMTRGFGGMGGMGQMGNMGLFGNPRPIPGKQGGGLLARLLGKSTSNPVNGAAGFPGFFPGARGGTAAAGGAASGGSWLKSLANPSAISGFLNNTQQMLTAAKQITPIVSQYGPMVKNLPLMWKLYRGFKEATSDTEKQDHSEKQDESTAFDDKQESQSDSKTSRKKSKTHHNPSLESSEFIESSSELEHLDIVPYEVKNGSFQEKKSLPKLYI